MPTLTPTRATLDGLIVSTAMEESPYLWAFSDDVVVGESCSSKLVMSRKAVRVRSSALFFSVFAGKTQRVKKGPERIPTQLTATRLA